MTPVLIIGGGISGLSTAYYLSKAGIPSRILEPRRLGGVIQTAHIRGCVIEEGPDSFLSAKPAAMDLIRDLGLADQVISSNDHARKTFVRRNGRLVELPDGLMMMVPTKIMPLVGTRLLSWPTKIRMGLELFRKPDRIEEDRSVADFVASHYGAEAVDYLAEPLLSGIYGGNPEALSVRSVLPTFVEMEAKYGSLTKGVLAARKKAPRGPAAPLFRTLKGGLGDLVTAVTSAIRASTEVIAARAETLEQQADGYRVRVDGQWIDARHVVLACEAHNAGTLAPDPALRDLLAGVVYSSSMTLALGFERAALPHLEGFGFLIPRRERKRLVACTYIGNKFPNRVPDDLVVLRCFLGGLEGANVLDESNDTLIQATLEELREIVGVKARPVFSNIARWPKSMAQYSVGHQQRVAAVNDRLTQFPGLHLAGNAYTGIGIPDCIRMGKQAAERITGFP